MPVDLSTPAKAVDARRRELEERLAALNKAPAYRKLDEARYVIAAMWEMLHAQQGFNQAVIGAVDELRRDLRIEAAGAPIPTSRPT